MDSYFEKRTKAIGFNPEIDRAGLEKIPGETASIVDHPTLWPDKKGNLCIGVITPFGELIGTDKSESNSRHNVQPWHITRFAIPVDVNGRKSKYLPSSPGKVYPYIPIELTKKVRNKTKIETLVITEGYLKAFVGAKEGIDIVALPGITVWKGKDDKMLFEWIRIVVSECDVKRIIFLTDGDTLKVEWAEGKDLYERPNSFYTAVKLFKMFCSDLNVDLQFTSINQDIDHKGLDDLLINTKALKEKKKIIKELLAHVSNENYFSKKLNVSASNYESIKKIFFIDDVKSFYDQYQNLLLNREFIYNNGVFQWDEEYNVLRCLRSGLAAPFVMIGGTIYKMGAKPTMKGNIENVLLPLQSEKQFQKLIGSKKLANQVFYDIPYFDGAINIPAHTNFIKQKVTTDKDGNTMRWYNVYRELSHQPVEGNFDTSISFIKHIFGTDTITYDGVDYYGYDLGLDYIQIMYKNPLHFLPILVLASTERHTGKTTFWNWMRAIFQQNCRDIRVEDLGSQFTSFYATSLLAFIEEAVIEKRVVFEKIKKLVTAERGQLEGKGKDTLEVDSFLKIGMSTNNIKNFAQVDSEEVRFWVREVKPVPESKFDFELEDKLIKEIPAFLHYLNNRVIKTPKRTRAWFPNELIETEALKELKANSKWKLEKEIDQELEDIFHAAGLPFLHYSIKDIRDSVLGQKTQLSDIRNVLDKKKIKPKVYSLRYDMWYIDGNGVAGVTQSKKGKYYTFKITDFILPNIAAKLLDMEKLKELEIEETTLIKMIGLKSLSHLFKDPKMVDDDTIKEIYTASKTFAEFHNLTYALERKLRKGILCESADISEANFVQADLRTDPFFN